MFDPDLYRKTCSEGLKLSGEKLEEMIFMTENKKRGLRKPVQIALIAAALAVVMCATAAAANPEAVQSLWHHITMSVSVVKDNGETMEIQTNAPEITVDDVDGRTILTIDGERADITDALAEDGKYVGDWSNEFAEGRITVYPDQTWEMDLTLADGSHVHTNSKAGWISFSASSDVDDGESKTYRFTDDETRTDATWLPPEE